MTTLAVRFDFATVLVEHESRRRRVADVLMRPCFDALDRVSAHRGDRWVDHAPKSAEAIVAILADRRNSAVSLDTGRGREIVASAEIKSGTREGSLGALPHYGYLALPVPANLEMAISEFLELADALETGAGFIAGELSYNAAQNVALGGAKPRPRPGLSTQQAIERRGRDWYYKQRHAELAGPEWGTFLGAEHLARLDIDRVRDSGVFERVVLISPRLAYMQITADPADDLRDDFEAKLQAAREVLTPILMDLSEVRLD